MLSPGADTGRSAQDHVLGLGHCEGCRHLRLSRWRPASSDVDPACRAISSADPSRRLAAVPGRALAAMLSKREMDHAEVQMLTESRRRLNYPLAPAGKRSRR